MWRSTPTGRRCMFAIRTSPYPTPRTCGRTKASRCRWDRTWPPHERQSAATPGGGPRRPRRTRLARRNSGLKLRPVLSAASPSPLLPVLAAGCRPTTFQSALPYTRPHRFQRDVERLRRGFPTLDSALAIEVRRDAVWLRMAGIDGRRVGPGAFVREAAHRLGNASHSDNGIRPCPFGVQVTPKGNDRQQSAFSAPEKSPPCAFEN